MSSRVRFSGTLAPSGEKSPIHQNPVLSVNACSRHLTRNPSHSSGVYFSMKAAISFLLALSSATYAAEAPRYSGSVWQRWEASDLVCTGLASAPVRTGITPTIDGTDCDQLAT